MNQKRKCRKWEPCLCETVWASGSNFAWSGDTTHQWRRLPESERERFAPTHESMNPKMAGPQSLQMPRGCFHTSSCYLEVSSNGPPFKKGWCSLLARKLRANVIPLVVWGDWTQSSHIQPLALPWIKNNIQNWFCFMKTWGTTQGLPMIPSYSCSNIIKHRWKYTTGPW